MKYTGVIDEQTACRDLVFAFLHTCWEQTGGANAFADPSTFSLKPDPFYARNDGLTEDVVNHVINEIDVLMLDEFKKFPGYHTNAQGVNVADGEHLVFTDLGSLPYDMKLAIVQGVDEIMQQFRIPEHMVGAGVDGQPVVEVVNCPNCGVYCTCGC